MDNEKKPENPYAFATSNGMRLMDYFAAQAMPVLLDRFINEHGGLVTTGCIEMAAKASYDIAKEMLKEREKH